MLWSALLSVMLRVLRVLARIVLSVTLCYLFLCSQCLSRWLYKKLVFLLFYNGDIIPVSAFLYFFIFLDRVKHTHGCLQRLLYLEIKQLRFPLLRLMCSHEPARGIYTYMHNNPATHARTHAHTHARTHARTRAHTLTLTHTDTHTQIHTHTHTHTHTRTRTRTHAHTLNACIEGERI